MSKQVTPMKSLSSEILSLMKERQRLISTNDTEYIKLIKSHPRKFKSDKRGI